MRSVVSVLVGAAMICCACAVAQAGTIAIWERVGNDPGGALQENGIPYPIDPFAPAFVYSGYVVLLEPTIADPAGNQTFREDPSNWSDVLYFIPNPVTPTTPPASNFQLWSDGCDDPSNPLSCFPSLSTVLAGNYMFMAEGIVSPAPPESDDSAFTRYEPAAGQPGYDYAGQPGNVYEIHSTSATPEPATLLLIGAGLSVLGFWRKPRAR